MNTQSPNIKFLKYILFKFENVYLYKYNTIQYNNLLNSPQRGFSEPINII